MSTDQQGFNQPSHGQADWDTDVNGNFDIIERGYRGKIVAGTNISTGQVLWVNSGRYAFPFNPTSEDVFPHAFAYKAVGSGEEDYVLLSGIVRSLSVLSACVPGRTMFANASGAVVGSYSAASRPIGFGLYEDGLYFDPARNVLPEMLTRTFSIDLIEANSNFFSLDVGKRGIVRRLECKGNSADLMDIRFYSGSARVSSELLYQTKSGGVAVYTGFIDQAMFPYRNTEAGTLSGLIFGTLRLPTDATPTSDTVWITLTVERFR
jgi:hypothetical protein